MCGQHKLYDMGYFSKESMTLVVGSFLIIMDGPRGVRRKKSEYNKICMKFLKVIKCSEEAMGCIPPPSPWPLAIFTQSNYMETVFF